MVTFRPGRPVWVELTTGTWVVSVRSSANNQRWYFAIPPRVATLSSDPGTETELKTPPVSGNCQVPIRHARALHIQLFSCAGAFPVGLQEAPVAGSGPVVVQQRRDDKFRNERHDELPLSPVRFLLSAWAEFF